MADCAADTAAVLAHLGADRCYTVGASGGGPHALACAALLADQVLACATVAGVGPFGAEGLDFLEGMGRENHEEFGAALAAYVAASFRQALATGVWGWFDDDVAFPRPWGFDLDRISVPVVVWQGGQDRMVPFTHGQWLAAHLPTAKAKLLPEEGHLSIAVDKFGEVVGELIAGAPKISP